MKKVFKNIFLNSRFFLGFAALGLLFIVAFLFPSLLIISKALFFLYLAIIGIDLFFMFNIKNGVKAVRQLPEKLSNGDINEIEISISNVYNFEIGLQLIDELPFQFQKRDFVLNTSLKSNTTKRLTYDLRPVKRGEYHFGNLNIYASSPIGLIARRFQFGNEAMLPNYPSFLQLRKYMLMAFSNKVFEFGLKKIRKIGHTMEFEQIKDYVQGDDTRNINWKATAKSNKLMINQFQDERSQPIYNIIDKGRVMKMPFHGLSLLDYAINATLVLSNIALKKHDKAGMFSFSRRVEQAIIAARRPSQMHKIMETLYNLDTDFSESDFARLYIDIKRHLTQRSLLLMYTNFETLDALHRQLPYLQAIAKHHVLVVIFFENTELLKLTQSKAKTIQEIFDKTIAEKFVYEKKLIVSELKKFGIQSVLTAPEDLTLNTINKYLEVKARGLI